MKINKVIIRPILTEKSTDLLKKNYYMFELDKKADKNKVKQVLEKIYSVKVGQVKIINRKGKVRKVGRRQKLKKLVTKKIAYVQLKEGKIDLFPKS